MLCKIMMISISEQNVLFVLGRRSNTTLRILSVNGGAGVPPKPVSPFSLKKKSVKGGRGVPPKSVTYFLDQNQVFFEQKTPFLALFEEKFSGKNP